MAIYHLEAKVISRGAGRSACAASAYLSCSHILNDYDGIQHDYTRKSGLVWQAVFLPEYAPQEWFDRAVLWNAVEANEKTKDSRLAREFVVALPIELGKEQWTALLTEYIQSNYMAEGMCADVAIHDTDGHNPHAHIMLTVRPLDEHGKWQYKTEKEYLCVREWIVPPFPESKPLMIRSTVPSPWQRPEGMFPIYWMNIRKNPAPFGNGFASTSRSKPHSARKKKTGIGNIYGQRQTNGAAQPFLFSVN